MPPDFVPRSSRKPSRLPSRRAFGFSTGSVLCICARHSFSSFSRALATLCSASTSLTKARVRLIMSSAAAAFSDSCVRSFSSAALALAKCGSTKPRSSAHSSSSILRSARAKVFHSDCAVFAAAIAAAGSLPIKSRRKRAINLRLSVSAALRCSFSFSLKPSLISRICLDSTARAFGSS